MNSPAAISSIFCTFPARLTNALALDRTLLKTEQAATEWMRQNSERARIATNQPLPRYRSKLWYHENAIRRDPKGCSASGKVGFSWAVYGEKGLDKSEYLDGYIVCELMIGGKRAQFFSVYDGHGDTRLIGEMVEQYLPALIEAELSKIQISKLTLCNAVIEAFGGVQEKIAAWQQEQLSVIREGVDTGVAISGVLVFDGMIYPLNLGDCRAVLWNGEEAVQLTVDMKPEDFYYQAMVKERGGVVAANGRVDGALAVAGSFGDSQVKGMISRPEVFDEIALSSLKENSYLLLVCDGITNVGDSKHLISEINEKASVSCFRTEQGQLKRIVKTLVRCAGIHSMDDRTAMMIKLRS